MNENYNDEYERIIEALLFAFGEPLGIAQIAGVLEISVSQARESIEKLKNSYDFDMRGLNIVQIEDKYQLTTRSDYFEYIKKLLKRAPSNTLSQAALETLSIIAYKQPVARSDIEYLRGVQSSSSLDLLIDKNLVRSCGKLDAPGRPLAFETTEEFLKLMNIKSLKELPEFEAFAEGIQLKLDEMSESVTSDEENSQESENTLEN